MTCLCNEMRVIPLLCRCGKIPDGCDRCDDVCSGGRRIDIVEVKREISWKKVEKSKETQAND